jgi:hypothetical protein
MTLIAIPLALLWPGAIVLALLENTCAHRKAHWWPSPQR